MNLITKKKIKKEILFLSLCYRHLSRILEKLFRPNIFIFPLRGLISLEDILIIPLIMTKGTVGIVYYNRTVDVKHLIRLIMLNGIFALNIYDVIKKILIHSPHCASFIKMISFSCFFYYLFHHYAFVVCHSVHKM